MEFFYSILKWNYILTVSVSAWFIAQVLKTIINFFLIGHLQIERMWGDGGMPSAHSATVCAMAVAAARYSGTESVAFGVACVFAIVTMHDAMGVRRETGEQAKVLNKMLEEWVDFSAKNFLFLADQPENKKLLKEMVGHTPIEVVSGALLGFLIGFMFPVI